jgi:RHS repeat-associated protein
MGCPKLSYQSAVRHDHPTLSIVKSGNRDFSFIGKEVAGAYVYGFQGQEKDDEIKGKGNSVNYKYRMHDPRLGRFFAVDPLTSEYPHYTPYSFSGNKLIHKVELEGLEETDYALKVSEQLMSGKSVYRAIFTLKVDQPETNKGKTTTRNVAGRLDVGHTFFTIEIEYTDGTNYSAQMGLWPDNGSAEEKKGLLPLFNNSVPPSYQDENRTGHNYEPVGWNSDISFEVNEYQLNQLGEYINGEATAETNYNLNWNNCTSFGKNCTVALGVELPGSFGYWGVGMGQSPGKLGGAINKSKDEIIRSGEDAFWSTSHNVSAITRVQSRRAEPIKTEVITTLAK